MGLSRHESLLVMSGIGSARHARLRAPHATHCVACHSAIFKPASSQPCRAARCAVPARRNVSPLLRRAIALRGAARRASCAALERCTNAVAARCARMGCGVRRVSLRRLAPARMDDRRADGRRACRAAHFVRDFPVVAGRKRAVAAAVAKRCDSETRPCCDAHGRGRRAPGVRRRQSSALTTGARAWRSRFARASPRRRAGASRLLASARTRTMREAVSAAAASTLIRR